MSKRLSLAGALCAGMIVIWGTNVHAWPASSSYWGVKYNTIHVNSSWFGIANTDVKPTDIMATIFSYQVVVYYKNPGGNTGGIGVPFNLSTEISGTETLMPTALRGAGKYTSTITFSDQDILSSIDPSILAANAPNPGWIAYAVDVLSLDVIIQAFADISTRCEDSWDASNCYLNLNDPANPLDDLKEEEVVHIEGSCTLQNGDYSCTENEHWEWSKKDPVYY